MNRYMDSRLGIRDLMAQRLAAMPAKDFERMLHPVVEKGVVLVKIGLIRCFKKMKGLLSF